MENNFDGTHIALHGFLGRPTDWEYFPSLKISGIDLFSAPILPFWDWAKAFNKKVAQTKPPRILTGYSLGGRLAMHALIENPSLWDAAVIISANPGLTDKAERMKRLSTDEQWAERFISEKWSTLMNEWNEQSVFGQHREFIERKDKDYSRNILSNALRTWSIGEQENLTAEIEKLYIPILWIAGSNDTKYAAIANDIALSHPASNVWIADGGSHRVPWEKKDVFTKEVEFFMI